MNMNQDKLDYMIPITALEKNLRIEHDLSVLFFVHKETTSLQAVALTMAI